LQPERKSKQPVSGVQIVADERKILRAISSPFFPPLSTFFVRTPLSKRLEQAKQLNVSELMNLFTVTNLPYIIHQLSLYLRSLYLYSGLFFPGYTGVSPNKFNSFFFKQFSPHVPWCLGI